MQKVVYIYALIDPNTQEIRYIGRSLNPLLRLNKHLYNAKNIKKNSTHCYCWIKGLLDNDQIPILQILEEVTEENWGEKEQYWINQFTNLTNMIDGGKFCPMLIPEVIEKMKETKRKNPIVVSKETRDKLSAAMKKRSAEGRYKKGWKQTEEWKKSRSKLSKELWENRNSEERKEIGKKITKGKYKPILQLDEKLNIIKIWSSIGEAEKNFYGTNKGQIKKYMNNNKMCKGFYWRFNLEASDPLVKNDINN